MVSGGGGGGGDWRPKPDVTQDGVPPADPCDIHELTTLSSPSASVVRGLSPGDVLDIQLRPGPPRVVEAHTSGGQVAGSITSPVLAQLVQCIQRGRRYQADVHTIRGGMVSVMVRPA